MNDSRAIRQKAEERRLLLRSALAGTALVGLSLAGLLPAARARAAARLRPPGAIDEDDFLAACIKCGQCVQVCPVEAIKLADALDGIGLGTPYIAARDQACDFSCDATQCVLACPTEALTHHLTKKEEVVMGKARLARPDACLARQGKGFKGPARGPDFTGLHRYEAVDRWVPQPIASQPYDLASCDLCVRECPIKGAISMEPIAGGLTPVVHDACVGCGMCEMICPVTESCFTIDVTVEKRGVRRVA